MNRRAFTVVELLIVIVVIAIIAAISLVSFKNVQIKADNASRLSELKAWEEAFELYAANTRTFPPAIKVSTGDNNVDVYYYCLGKHFPIGGGGVPRCREYGGTSDLDDSVSPRQSKSDTLMQQLEQYSKVTSHKKQPIKGTVGPYARVYYDSPPQNDPIIEITQIFDQRNNGPQCPNGTEVQYVHLEDNRLWCMVKIKL
jgi:prepilin-type N-terminal cleavage/methylation domain-containing protein